MTHVHFSLLYFSGLYVKFGQGLVAMNHILPIEYTGTLKVLQDKCLRRQSADEIDKVNLKLTYIIIK